MPGCAISSSRSPRDTEWRGRTAGETIWRCVNCIRNTNVYGLIVMAVINSLKHMVNDQLMPKVNSRLTGIFVLLQWFARRIFDCSFNDLIIDFNNWLLPGVGQ
jgi:hypothetical protein